MSASFRRASILIICAVVLTSVAVYIYKSQKRYDPTSSIELRDDVFAATTAAAKGGDAKAAVKLSRHFLAKKKYKLAYTWMQRAQELGDSGAESDLNEMRTFLPPEAMTDSDTNRQENEK